jgi:hypothetical protein
VKIQIDKITVVVNKGKCPLPEEQKISPILGYVEKNGIRCNNCHYFGSFIMGYAGMPVSIVCNYK